MAGILKLKCFELVLIIILYEIKKIKIKLCKKTIYSLCDSKIFMEISGFR